MRIVRLEATGALAVTGEERQVFLQGQLTQDLLQLGAAGTALSGWCNPKGRLLAVGQLINWRDQLLWLLPAALIESSIARLRMFLLRSRASLEAAPLQVFGVFEAAGDVSLGDVRLAADQAVAGSDSLLVARVVGDPSRAWILTGDADAIPELRGAAAGDGEWAQADLRAGLPRIVDATTEAFVPQMVNLDLLGGISFSKGCYVGQEVVARTQNLGRIKRRMYRFAAPLPAQPGEPVLDADGANAGKVVSCAGSESGAELLAVVQIRSAGGPLYVDEAAEPLRPLALPYAIPTAED